MIVPVLAGVAALYGYYRYEKSKELAALTTPPGFATTPAPLPGYAAPVVPTAKQAQSILKAVQSYQAAPINPAIYGKGATTQSVPSDRIPSSAYGATGPTPAPTTIPNSPVQYSASGGFSFKI